MTSTKSSRTSLKDLHADQTQQLILSAAVQLLEKGSVPDVTARALAREAGISERTVFRYYATRDELLDAIAAAVTAKLAPPAPPRSLEELLNFPNSLFNRFEANIGLTRAALHSEIFHRIQSTTAKERWSGIQKLMTGLAPRAPERKRKLVAANIRYLLSATTWHYYRFIFEFSPGETVDAIRSSIRESLRGLGALTD